MLGNKYPTEKVLRKYDSPSSLSTYLWPHYETMYKYYKKPEYDIRSKKWA